MEQKIKVLHIVKSMVHGGIETFLMSMLRNYDRNQFHMDILYTGQYEGPYAPEARALGAQLIPCPMGNEQIRFMYEFYQILKSTHYDVINNHLSDMGGAAILIAKIAGVPVRVCSYHTNLPDIGWLKNFYLRTMRRIVVRYATAITTSSPDVSMSHFTAVPARTCMVTPISYGVDTTYFAQRPSNLFNWSEFGFLAGDPIIGHVGSYRPQKNHETLVRIAASVIKQIPNARFVFCGSAGNNPKNIKVKENICRLISHLNIKSNITMVEGVSDMRQFYHAIDLFVLPSRHEGMPISIIEAQASGKPIVASRLGGIEVSTAPQMQQNLFAIDEIEPFANCVVDLIRDRQKRLTQGLAGQQFATHNLDIKVAVRKYEQLYLPNNNGEK